MTHYFIIPGYQGSGPDHWQTWIENKQPNFHRIHQKNWNNPDINDWTATIDKVLSAYEDETIVLVAHSLGCLTVAEWFKRYNRKVKAALLVAPPDLNLVRKNINTDLFKENPILKLPFKSVLVASSNDPWISIDTASSYAKHWGSDFINIGDAGHINNLSGYGEWEQGYEILKTLA